MYIVRCAKVIDQSFFTTNNSIGNCWNESPRSRELHGHGAGNTSLLQVHSVISKGAVHTGNNGPHCKAQPLQTLWRHSVLIARPFPLILAFYSICLLSPQSPPADCKLLEGRVESYPYQSRPSSVYSGQLKQLLKFHCALESSENSWPTHRPSASNNIRSSPRISILTSHARPQMILIQVVREPPQRTPVSG